ncbi:MAG: phosphate transport system permease protein [Desulfonauticus sp.]|jgi:phosphate transport system permease protein|nr:phosphate transport system permease protein [Desulfonauticus sp.]
MEKQKIKLKEILFTALSWCGLGYLLSGLAILGYFLATKGILALNKSLFWGDAPIYLAIVGKYPVWDGIWPAMVGTFMLVFISTLISVPLGIGCGIYLTFFLKGRLKAIFNFCLDLLAGIPSIVMGLFGFVLILFLRRTIFPRANTSLLLAGFCLALLVLPYIIRTTQNAFLSLSEEQRLIGPSLGFSYWQNFWFVLLPQASKGILSGIILAMGRTAEDTAVILLTGVVANAGMFQGLTDKFEALPFYIYYTAAEFRSPEDLQKGFASCIILLILTSMLFLLANTLQRWIKK